MNQGTSLRSLHSFKKDVKKEISALKTHGKIRKFTSKFNAKKKTLEMKVKKEVHAEIKKATKFLEARKRDLNNFQKKVNSMIKRKLKQNGNGHRH